MSNKVYDVLKFIAQIVLPAVATLYFALASICALLGISTAAYKKGAKG